MPTFAVLGATGSTGQALLNILLQSPKNTVNAYVLHKLSPQYQGHDNLHIFEGALGDVALLADCISNTSAVLCVLGSNESEPGIRVAQDAAHSIVAACCRLRAQDPDVMLPRIVFLSSATINPRLCRDLPPAARWALHTSFSYVYDDLEHAEAYFRLHKDWLDVTFIQPGGLVHDTPKGHALSLERQQTFLSYPDLAAGIIEAAIASGEEYSWKGVSVVPTSNDTKVEWRVPLFMASTLSFSLSASSARLYHQVLLDLTLYRIIHLRREIADHKIYCRGLLSTLPTAGILDGEVTEVTLNRYIMLKLQKNPLVCIGICRNPEPARTSRLNTVHRSRSRLTSESSSFHVFLP